MKSSTASFRCYLLLLSILIIHTTSHAHNGKIAHARPLGKIKVDGNLNDWPARTMKYNIATSLAGDKINDENDFSASFQVGYRLEDQSMFVGLVITDNDFVEDTSAAAAYNTQDCFELCLDGRHLPKGSGVASFMYSKKLKNINKAFYDPFASAASWDIMEVAQTINGKVRTYEWRIKMGSELAVGKSVGLDFQVFDRDADGSFTISGWGEGGYKFRTAGALGDIIIIPADQKFGTVQGTLGWDRESKLRLPQMIGFKSENSKLWFNVGVDSLGNYYAESVVPGKYELFIPDTHYFNDDKPVILSAVKRQSAIVRAGQKSTVNKFVIGNSTIPDIIPEQGVLLNFTNTTAKQVDDFVATYQKYYTIPGVSLALIKDGMVVYHKTYGVKNAQTGEKVDDNTLFEAASVTKPVFAFAVERLAERGIINLDKPLYQYLPYPDIESDERYKLITARHVLTHRTGFPNWRSMNADGKLNIMFTPGTSYNYSGEGFEYLKLVVQKITGKNVEQVLKEEVIGPVGLYHTFFSANDSLRKVVANGHYDMMPSPADLPEAPGMAWSMHTEAQIFTRFMLYMLEQKGLSPQMYDMMFTKHSDFKFDPEDELPRYPSYMGMSLEIRETPNGKSFGHGGNNGDFLCQFEVYKDIKAGYVVFTNSNTSSPFLSAMRDFLVDGKQKNQ